MQAWEPLHCVGVKGLLGVSGPLVMTFPPVHGGPELTVGYMSTVMPGWQGLLAIPGMTLSGVGCLATLPRTSSHCRYSDSSVLKGSASIPLKLCYSRCANKHDILLPVASPVWARGVASRWTREPGSLSSKADN